MVNVIINADDLGVSAIVNNCIEKALSDKLISSSTILANTSFCSTAQEIVNSHPDASFGAHLNATQGRALTNSIVLKKFGIVDDTNNFTKEIKQIKKFPPELMEAIFNEWDAQIKFIKEMGVHISHLDGHHHVHTIGGLLPVLLELKKKYNIICNRNRYASPRYKKKASVGKNTKFHKNSPTTMKRTVFSRIYNRISTRFENFLWKRRIYISGGAMTNYFDSYQSVCDKLEEGMIIPDFSSIELMCHPGHINYQAEFKEIIKRRLSTLLKNFNLINYNQLCH